MLSSQQRAHQVRGHVIDLDQFSVFPAGRRHRAYLAGLDSRDRDAVALRVLDRVDPPAMEPHFQNTGWHPHILEPEFTGMDAEGTRTHFKSTRLGQIGILLVPDVLQLPRQAVGSHGYSGVKLQGLGINGRRQGPALAFHLLADGEIQVDDINDEQQHEQ